MTDPAHPTRSLLAGTVAAVTASVCCVGPLALLMLSLDRFREVEDRFW